ncbi:protein translocase subunit [Bachmanniomyces sp. S44760]|nr:protein translocase subunit [Bachmanniomyces sp. S44760]
MDSINSSDLTGNDSKSAVMRQIRQEAGIAQYRQLMEKLNDHCFAHCVPSPGSSLSRKEETCLTQCMEKYIASWQIVSQQYIKRGEEKLRSSGQMPGM